MSPAVARGASGVNYRWKISASVMAFKKLFFVVLIISALCVGKDTAATTQGIDVSRETDKEDGRQTTTVQPAGITHDVILTDIQAVNTKAAEPSAAETTQAALSTDVQAVAAEVAEQPDDATQAAVHAQAGTAAVEQPKLATTTTTSTSAVPSTSEIASTQGSSSTAATTTVHPLCLRVTCPPDYRCEVRSKRQARLDGSWIYREIRVCRSHRNVDTRSNNTNYHTDSNGNKTDRATNINNPDKSKSDDDDDDKSSSSHLCSLVKRCSMAACPLGCRKDENGCDTEKCLPFRPCTPGRPWCGAGFRCRRHHVFEYFYCKPTDDDNNNKPEDSSSSSSSTDDQLKKSCRPQRCPRFCPEGCRIDRNGCQVGQCTRRICRDRSGKRLCSRNQVCKKTPPPRNCYGSDCHWKDECKDKSTSGFFWQTTPNVKFPPSPFGQSSSSQDDDKSAKKMSFCPIDDSRRNRRALARILNRVRSVVGTTCSTDADCTTAKKCCFGVVQTAKANHLLGKTCQDSSERPPSLGMLRKYIRKLLRG